MTPFLKADIKACEGFRSRAYPDPESPLAKTGKGDGSPWTIGWGHCGIDVHPGLEWTPAQAEAALDADIARTVALLDAKLPWWRQLSDAREDVVLNLAFNMGIGNARHGLLSFKRSLAAIDAGNYAAAADGLLASLWATQVGKRAKRLATQLRTGVRQA